MKTWMLLWAAAVSLVLATLALAEPNSAAADSGPGLDFDGAGFESDPAPEPVDSVSLDAVDVGESEQMDTAEAETPDIVEAGTETMATSETVVDIGNGEGIATAEPAAAEGAVGTGQAFAGEGIVATGGAVDVETDSELAAVETLATADDTELSEIATPVAEAAPTRQVALGPMGVDDEGRTGRIHTVGRGDTLWDISAAYLGTPWVWPSVWNDNDGISNPHRIAPGDHIWITAGEMRIVTDAQKNELMSAVPDEVASTETEWPEDDTAADEFPAALGEDDELMAASEPTTMDELPVAVPTDAQGTTGTGAMVRVSEAESLGYVSPDTLDAAASIVDSSVPRTWLVDGDEIYIGLGEGEVEPGDEFTIYRDHDAVRDLDGTLLGYHIEVLGWARVHEVEAESSKAEIRMSQSEVRRGDRVIPRDPMNISVPVKRAPDAVPGNIVYMPDSRTAMADGEWVYLNRGNLHGVEPGTEMEVYIPGRLVKDQAKRQKVMTPDNVVAQLIVVDSQPDSAVAYIVHSRRALAIGDKVRPRAKKLAQR